MNMKCVFYAFMVLGLSLLQQTTIAQVEAQKAEIEYVDVMPMPGFPNESGEVTDNAIDIILKLKNPELAGKAMVSVRKKDNPNGILSTVEVRVFEKNGLIHYAIGKRERALKRNAALVNIPIGELVWEEVSVEVTLYDTNNNEIDKK